MQQSLALASAHPTRQTCRSRPDAPHIKRRTNAEKPQNISDICKNTHEIFKNINGICRNISDILSLFRAVVVIRPERN
jgi:hypothetical protein